MPHPIFDTSRDDDGAGTANQPPIGGDHSTDVALSSSASILPVRRTRDDRLEIPSDPTAVFEQVIAGNERVCQECFRLLRRWERFPDEKGDDHGDVLAFVEYDLPEHAPHWSIADREYYESVRERDRLDRTHSPDGETTYCTNCGTTSPHRSPSTRSLEDARDAAATLSVTLHELGIAHDWVHLVERVQTLKREPDTAGDDFACFSRATAAAIDRSPDDR
jgi:hypothetical protein